MAKQITINQAKYDRENTKRYSLKLNKVTDRDVIKKIEDTAKELGGIQLAIKHLILKNED